MATTSVRTVFLDTNILLRANVAEAPLHSALPPSLPTERG